MREEKKKKLRSYCGSCVFLFRLDFTAAGSISSIHHRIESGIQGKGNPAAKTNWKRKRKKVLCQHSFYYFFKNCSSCSSVKRCITGQDPGGWEIKWCETRDLSRWIISEAPESVYPSTRSSPLLPSFFIISPTHTHSIHHRMLFGEKWSNATDGRTDAPLDK